MLYYTYFPSVNSGYVISGPRIDHIDNILEESKAVELCKALNQAFIAGKEYQIVEVKKVLGIDN